MAVMIGEAAIAIRADASGTAEEIQDEVGPAAEKAGKDAGDVLGSKMALGIAAVGATVAAGFNAALEQAALGDKLSAQLGLTEGQSAAAGKVAGSLYADAYGGSMEEVDAAVAAVMGSISGMRDASAADLEAITGSALNFATAMDVDVSSAATSAGILVKNGLAANAGEAFDLLTVAAQEAGPAMVEPVMEAANEYGTNFAAMGISGRAAMAMLVDASAGGEIALDKAGDAVKEFGIRATDLGDTGAQAALQGLGLSGEDMANKLLAGGDTASAAFSQIVSGLQGIDDPAAQANAAVALFGTPLEDIGKDKLPAFLDAMQQSGGELENVAGAAGRMGDTLNDNASSNLTSFTRGLQQTFVDLLGGQVIPVVQSIYGWLHDNLGPALTAVGGFITDNVVPPLQTLITWLGQNDTVVQALAWTIGTVLVAALGVWGTRSLVEAGKNTVAWFTTAASSQAGAATQQRSALQVVAGWIMMGAQALFQGLKVAAVWTAQVVASAVTGAASFAVQVARVVAGWVLMGVQSLIQAGRMAAAWFIALGPVGWVIAAVIGLVALIIANWDKVKAFTVRAFQAVVGAVKTAWTNVTGAISTGITAAVNFVKGLPGKVLGALGNFGSLLYNKGRDLITGLVNGIASAASFVGGIARNVVNAIIGFINNQVIFRLNDFLDFTVMGIHINAPDIPMIPKLHSGGVFDSGGGEGLALLRDQERVITPQQRVIADRLLNDLIGGTLTPAAAPAAAGGTAVQIDVHASPGMSVGELSAHVASDLGWALSTGSAAAVPLPAGASA